jgi:hypothetical protein
VEPEVRYFILCEDVRTDPDNYHRINVFGLTTSISSAADPPFPVVRGLLCALLLFSDGHGNGELRVIFRSSPRRVRFVGDPEAVRGAVFGIRNCSFPMGGLYWVEAVFENSVIARQKLHPKG